MIGIDLHSSIISATADFSAQLGKHVGSSAWRPIAQARIDRFAEATDDFQFVHVDQERAVREAPFGGTIAHGLLTLSMISTLAEEIMPVLPELNTALLVNVDRVKFLSPVRSGSRIRGVFSLGRASRLSPGKLLMKLHCVIEIENERKPAMSCDVSWLLLLDQAPAAAGPSTSRSQVTHG